MAQGTLDIGVVLNGFGFANEQLGAIQSRIEGLRDTIGRVEALSIDGIDETTDQFGSLETAVKQLGQGLTDVALTSATQLSNALLNLNRDFRESGIQLEQMTIALTRFADEGESAKTVMSEIVDLSKLPMVDLQSAMRSFVALRSTRMEAEDTSAVIEQFSVALASVGASSEDLNGVTRALTQIMAKGKVYAEEIYQIAERLPQTRAVMQDAFGTANTEELAKEGITAYQFINEITRGLQAINKDSSGLMDTTANAITNLNNQLFLLKANLAGNMDVFKGFTKGLTNILELLNSESEGLLNFVGSFSQIFQGLLQVGTTLLGTGLAFGALGQAIKTFKGGADKVATSTGGLVTVLGQGLHGSLKGLLSPFKLIVKLLGAFGLTVSTTVAVIGTLGVALLALGGYFGWLWLKQHKQKKATEELTDATKKYEEVQKDLAKVDASLAESNSLINRYNTEIDKMEELRKQYRDGKKEKDDFFKGEEEKSNNTTSKIVEDIKDNFQTLSGEIALTKDQVNLYNVALENAQKVPLPARKGAMQSVQNLAKDMFRESLREGVNSIETNKARKQIEKNRKDTQRMSLAYSVSSNATLEQRAERSLLENMAQQGKFSTSDIAGNKGARTNKRRINLRTVEEIDKAKTQLEQSWQNLADNLPEGVNTEQLRNAYEKLNKNFESEKIIKILNDDKYNIEGFEKNLEKRTQELEKRIESLGTNAFDPNYVVRGMMAQQQLIQTQLDGIPESGTLSQTASNEFRADYEQLGKTEKEFNEFLKNNDEAREAYLDLVQKEGRDNDKRRARLESQLAESQAISQLSDANMREILMTMHGFDSSETAGAEGYKSVIEWLKTTDDYSKEATKKMVKELEDLFALRYGDDVNVSGDLLKQAQDLTSTEGTAEVKEIRKILQEKNTLETLTSSGQISEVIQAIATALRAGGANLSEQLRNLAQRDISEDSQRDAEKLKKQFDEGIKNQQVQAKVVGSYINETYRNLFSTTADYEMKGMQLEQEVASAIAKYDATKPDTEDAIKLAKERLQNYKDNLDFSKDEVKVVQRQLEANKDKYQKEQELIKKQEEIDLLSLNRTESQSAINAKQNELQNQIDLQKIDNKIVEHQANLTKAQVVKVATWSSLSNQQKEILDEAIAFDLQQIEDLGKRKTNIEKRGEIQGEIDGIEVQISENELKNQMDILKLKKQLFDIRGNISTLGSKSLNFAVKQGELDIQIKTKEKEVESALLKITEKEGKARHERLSLELDELRRQRGMNEDIEKERKELDEIAKASRKREFDQEVFQAYGIGSIGMLGQGKDVATGYFKQLTERRNLTQQLADEQKKLQAIRSGENDKDDIDQVKEGIDILVKKLGTEELTRESINDIQEKGRQLSQAILDGNFALTEQITRQLKEYEGTVGSLNIIDVLTGNYLQRQTKVAELLKKQNIELDMLKLNLADNVDLAKLWAESLDPDSLMGDVAKTAYGGMSTLFKGLRDSVINEFGDGLGDDPQFMQTMLDLYQKRILAEKELKDAQKHSEEAMRNHVEGSEERLQAEQRLAKAIANFSQVQRDELRGLTQALESYNQANDARLNDTISHMEKIQNAMYRLQEAEYELYNPMATNQQKERFSLEQKRLKILTDAQYQFAKLGEVETDTTKAGSHSWIEYGKAIEIAMNSLVEYTEWQVEAQKYNNVSRNVWKEMIEKEQKYNQAREGIESKHVSSMLSIRKKYGQEFADLAKGEGEMAEDFAEKRNQIQSRKAQEEINVMKQRDKATIDARNQYREETGEFYRRNRGATSQIEIGGDPFKQLSEKNQGFKEFLDAFINPEIDKEVAMLNDNRYQGENKFLRWITRANKKRDRSDTVLGKMSKTQAFKQVISEKGIMSDIRSGMSMGDAIMAYGGRIKDSDVEGKVFFEKLKENFDFEKWAYESKPVEEKQLVQLEKIANMIEKSNKLDIQIEKIYKDFDTLLIRQENLETLANYDKETNKPGRNLPKATEIFPPPTINISIESSLGEDAGKVIETKVKTEIESGKVPPRVDSTPMGQDRRKREAKRERSRLTDVKWEKRADRSTPLNLNKIQFERFQ